MPPDSGILGRVGLHLPRLLLPTPDVSLPHWAVVACDQYTSQPEYWRRVEQQVRGHVSTLNLILPEAYLEQPDTRQRVHKINETMNAYLAEGVLREEKPGFMLVERTTAPDRIRHGLVVALDLENYDYGADSVSLVRATEGTIVERLPPRMEIRRHAALELPHIMVLIDDPGKTVIEPLLPDWDQPRYDFELMEGGGCLRGHLIADDDTITAIARRLTELATLQQMQAKYGTTTRGVFLYAMGDGNHSLATAKAIWEERKAGRDTCSLGDDPARYALVELVNVHDVGLRFEPIHRVLFRQDPATFLTALDHHFDRLNVGYSRTQGGPEVVQQCLHSSIRATTIAYCSAEGWGVLRFERPPHTLAVGTLQPFLDQHLATHPDTGIDYVHGADVVEKLGQKPGNIGFFLPAIPKHDLFKTVVRDGVLPRKAFSMGDAFEKRFYMEGRKIAP